MKYFGKIFLSFDIFTIFMKTVFSQPIHISSEISNHISREDVCFDHEIFTIFISEPMDKFVQYNKAFIFLHLLILSLLHHVDGQILDMEKRATLHVTGDHDLGMEILCT